MHTSGYFRENLDCLINPYGITSPFMLCRPLGQDKPSELCHRRSFRQIDSRFPRGFLQLCNRENNLFFLMAACNAEAQTRFSHGNCGIHRRWHGNAPFQQHVGEQESVCLIADKDGNNRRFAGKADIEIRSARRVYKSGDIFPERRHRRRINKKKKLRRPLRLSNRRI